MKKIKKQNKKQLRNEDEKKIQFHHANYIGDERILIFIIFICIYLYVNACMTDRYIGRWRKKEREREDEGE